jgi:hypothetical protein
MNRYFLPIIFSLLTVAVYVFSIDPLWSDIQQRRAREDQLTGYLADAKIAQAKIDDIKAQYDAFPQGSDDDLHVLLPDSVDSTKLIIDIEAVVTRRGLFMKGPTVSNTSNTVNGSSVAATTFAFSVKAPYPIFRDLLRDLEASLALRDLATIGFTTTGVDSGTKGNPEQYVHTYNIGFTTYSLAE